MLDINSNILKLLYDHEYQQKALEAFNQGKYFDVFNNSQYKKNHPYIVSEENFLKIIKKADDSKRFKDIFMNIEPFILNSENMTDLLFESLLSFAKKQNEWIYLGLCHANLSEEKNKRLKTLGLDESLWY